MTLIAPGPRTSSTPGVIALPGNIELPRKRFTRDEYSRLISLGLVEEGPLYELIEGEIVQKVGQTRRHAVAGTRVSRLLMQAFSPEQIQTQLPVDNFNEPEPDIAVVRNDTASYVDETPGPADTLLLVEVSNTTLRFDRGVKAEIYARVGIPEYWILDVNGRTLDVYRQPAATGYASVAQLSETDTVSPLAAPQAAPSVADFLPPATAENTL